MWISLCYTNTNQILRKVVALQMARDKNKNLHIKAQVAVDIDFKRFRLKRGKKVYITEKDPLTNTYTVLDPDTNITYRRVNPLDLTIIDWV